ncbi:MAG: hypothetical protein LAT83_21590 [Kiritimatiellae bacterium]|nr:hypothetical protein [Kiritimatiellia bacterium]
MENTPPTSFHQGRPWLWFLIFALFLTSHHSIFTGEFVGEDEVMQWQTSRNLFDVMLTGSLSDRIRGVGNLLAMEWHPPLRYLLSIPGSVLFPWQEVGVRLGAVLCSLVMTLLLMKQAAKEGGVAARNITGLLVAASGVYNWTSMAFAWSLLVAAVCVCALIMDESSKLELPKEKSFSWRVQCAFGALFVAYLINSGAILFSGGLGLALVSANRKRLPSLALNLVPIAAVYVLYWYLFLVFPEMSGQLLQTRARAGMSGLSVSPFLENLMGWNAYGLPFLFNAIWMMGLYRALKRKQPLVWIVSPFVLAWSFYLSGQSHQYFLLGTLPLIPFGVAQVLAALKRKQFPTLAFAVPFVMLTLIWNLYLFQWPYPARKGDLGTARPPLRFFLGYAGRYHNARHDWRGIAQTLKQELQPGETYALDFGGAFQDFYMRGNSAFVPMQTQADFLLTFAEPEAVEYVFHKSFPRNALKMYKRSTASEKHNPLSLDAPESVR